MKKQFEIDFDATPLITEGLTIKRHIPGDLVIWQRRQPLSLYRSEMQREDLVDGHDLKREVSGLPTMNICGQQFFFTHQFLMPLGVRQMSLFFWGTTLLDTCELEYVPCLYWDKGRWHCGMSRLDDLFGEGDMSVLYPQ